MRHRNGIDRNGKRTITRSQQRLELVEHTVQRHGSQQLRFILYVRSPEGGIHGRWFQFGQQRDKAKIRVQAGEVRIGFQLCSVAVAQSDPLPQQFDSSIGEGLGSGGEFLSRSDRAT